MSHTETAAEGSALKQVMVKSVALKRDLDLKQGWIWEAGGFGSVAKALKDEYTKLLVVHDQIEPKVKDATEPLRKRFQDLETAMQALEDEHITNDDTLRNKHKDKVSAQITVAKKLAEDVDAEIKQREKEAAAARAASAKKQLQDDILLIKKLASSCLDWNNMDTGGVEIAGAKELRGSITQFEGWIEREQRPFTDKQRKILQGFDTVNEAYKKAVEAEKKTKADIEVEKQEEKAKQEALEKERKAKEALLAKWKVALSDAIKAAEAWPTDPVLVDGAEIFGTGQESQGSEELKKRRELEKLIAGLSVFKEGEPKQGELDEAAKKIDDLGGWLRSKLGPVVAGRDAFVAKAVDAVEEVISKRGEPPGAEGYVKDFRNAAGVFTGLVEDIRDAYRVKHFDSAPQKTRRAQQAKSKAGEDAKFDKVGGWMGECGLGGSPRSGPNGPVFMSAASTQIGEFKTHFSQYQANAEVPPKGMASTTAEAMAALFAGSGVFCPHLTQERSPQHGSPDNARYFASGRFLPGNTPLEQQDALESKMAAELKRMLGVFKARIGDILKP